jgi:phosphoribosylglycinamide formyltransferase-1
LRHQIPVRNETNRSVRVGFGSNAENIISYFKKGDLASVMAVFSNNAEAQVLHRAKKHGVPAVVFSKEELQTESPSKK